MVKTATIVFLINEHSKSLSKHIIELHTKIIVKLSTNFWFVQLLLTNNAGRYIP